MIYTLSGNDQFALQNRLEQLTNDFIKEHGRLSIERFDVEESEPDNVMAAIFALSLFSENKMVIVRRVASAKELLENIAGRTEEVPDKTVVVLVDSKLDKRARYYKLLQKNTNFELFEQGKYPNLSGWVEDQVKEQKGVIDKKAAHLLVERVGTDKHFLHNEIIKLVTYNPKITRETIELLCEPSPQSSIFDLIDAVFAGNTRKSAKLYDEQREQRIEPLAIIGMIAWQLNIVALLKTAKDRADGEIAKNVKLSPFVIQKTRRLSQKISLQSLKKMIAMTLQLDVRLKSESIDADEAMHHLLLRLTSV